LPHEPTLYIVGNLEGRSVFRFLVALILVSSLAWADSSLAKTRVGIHIAKDRWLTLTDGTRVTQGREISYLLANQLFNFSEFEAVLLDNDEPVHLDLKVTPHIETLLYASGSRSNRLVYGFAPDRVNIFNSGIEGSLENEFVASGEEASQCIKPDFFEGRFNTHGWGPLSSNFGANFDEGFVINIAGYGIGFKQKKFEIKNQIRFAIEDMRSGKKQDLIFDIKAYGKDTFIAGSYSGFALGLEIQRRETLIEALKKILPIAVDGIIREGLIPLNHKGIVEKVKNFSEEIEIKMPKTQRAAVQANALGSCLEKSGNWLEDSIEGIFSFYAYWRYKKILDQPLKSKISALPLNVSNIKVAIIDSGIDYNDKKIGKNVIRFSGDQVLGFDFISWDSRPSDDNGHGTATAKYFLKTIKTDYAIIPIKVIGPFGDTHSSAIYDGFSYAVNQKVDAIVVPWAPALKLTEAYKRGAQLAAQNGIAVFVAPKSMEPGENIFVATVNGQTAFKTKGLGKMHLELPADGVAVVDEFNLWLQNTRGNNK